MSEDYQSNGMRETKPSHATGIALILAAAVINALPYFYFPREFPRKAVEPVRRQYIIDSAQTFRIEETDSTKWREYISSIEKIRVFTSEGAENDTFKWYNRTLTMSEHANYIELIVKEDIYSTALNRLRDTLLIAYTDRKPFDSINLTAQILLPLQEPFTARSEWWIHQELFQLARRHYLDAKKELDSIEHVATGSLEQKLLPK